VAVVEVRAAGKTFAERAASGLAGGMKAAIVARIQTEPKHA
jgi:hypothetical protein